MTSQKSSSLRAKSVRNALAIAVACALPLIFASHASAQSRIGVLECNISGGVGFIITSQKALSCAFRGTDGRAERYVGTIRKFGLDIGFTGPAKLVWGVFAPSKPGPGALTGDYAGASASASAGVGLGANALVGGARRSINLQPVSVQAQTGVNVTAGVSELFLQYMPR